MFLETLNLIVNSNKSTLQTLDALSGNERFPHAVLFESTDKILLEGFSLHTAMRFLCKENNKPCLNCKGCGKVLRKTHIDMIITGENCEKSYNIDSVRNLRKKTYIKPNESEKTVFILNNADTIPEKSQNALLKIIEEPPEHVIFIFTCENRFKLLETILSRVVSFKLNSPPKEEAFNILKSMGITSDDNDIINALSFTDNNLSSAEDFLQSKNDIFNLANEIYEYIQNRDIYNILLKLDISAKEKNMEDVLNRLKFMLANQASEYIRNESFISNLTVSQLIKIIDVIDKSILMAQLNANKSVLPCYIASQIDMIINNIKI